jgi:hypothetical protein
MALTMTRTRTQTALTKLSQMVANIHGELAVIERLLSENTDATDAPLRRKSELLQNQAALYCTLIQFDPEIDPSAIGISRDWLRAFGRGPSKNRIKKYAQSLAKQ